MTFMADGTGTVAHSRTTFTGQPKRRKEGTHAAGRPLGFDHRGRARNRARHSRFILEGRRSSGGGPTSAVGTSAPYSRPRLRHPGRLERRIDTLKEIGRAHV